MKVALVYDRINKFGGAERLLLSLTRLFPNAPIYTLVHHPSTSDWAKDLRVIPTFLNHFGFLTQRHEWLAPLAPLAFETFDLSEFDMVISLTSGDAKSVITRPHQLHLCYCLTPTRYFWSGAQEYARDKKLKLLPRFIKNYFKTVDLLTSTRPDQYLSISREVQNRVKKYYKRKSLVIYPHIEDKFYSKKVIGSDKREFFLVVSRLVPYKKVDLVVEVFNQLGLPLIIVGTGTELARLKRRARPNISFVGAVTDTQLIRYYRRAKALIFPQEEDFGLVPLESQASGTPVIAFGRGGALETVVNRQTGLFFAEQTEASLTSALLEFEKMTFSPRRCLQNALKFRQAVFSKNFSKAVSLFWQNHLKNLS